MKARELISDLEILWTNADLDVEISAVVADTRKIVPGALFVCIEGTKFDSHAAAREMAASGARILVVSHRLEEDLTQIVVADTREAVTRLFAAFYGHPERSFSHIIGITGTNGKTSTSMMLRHVFESAGHRVGLIGTTKYVVGDREYDAPLTTPGPEELFGYFSEMRAASCDTLIMEVSSHSLSQKRVAGIPFTVGIFTNLTQDHLDYHGTMEAYRREKEKLFSMCKLGIINADDAASGHFLASAACPVYTYGLADADFSGRDLSLSVCGVQYRMRYKEDILSLSVGIPGRFTVYNSMAAASAALLSGIPKETVEQALCTMEGVPGRMQRLEGTGNVSVILDYAHTPDALENVLTTLKALPHGRIYTLFGCGGDRDPKKRPIMGEIACRYSDRVVVTSDNPRTEDPEKIIRDILAGCEKSPALWRVITDRTEAIRVALSAAQQGDVVLLAGKGHEEYVIDRTGKHPYSEREIVRQFYQTGGEGQL